MIRLFVALRLPDAARRRLEGLRGGVPGARWQTAEQMHLTLRFIGEVDGAAFGEIRDALARIEAAAFSLEFRGVGHFPPRGPARALWAGVTADPALTRLRERVEAAVTGLGFAPERRNFVPHVTLARFGARVPARRLQGVMADHALFAAGPFPVRSFALFSSRIGAHGAHYTIEARYPLAPAADAGV